MSPEQRIIQPLTRRERETLELIAQGGTTKQIAENLHIARPTAGKHVTNVLHKLGAHSKAGATLIAFKEGLVSLSLEGGWIRGGLETRVGVDITRTYIRLLDLYKYSQETGEVNESHLEKIYQMIVELETNNQHLRGFMTSLTEDPNDRLILSRAFELFEKESSE